MRYRNRFRAPILLAFVIGAFFVLFIQSGYSAGSGQAATAGSQSQARTQSTTTAQGATAKKPVWQGAQASRLSHRAELYYEGVWGISELRVKTAESGQLIRFNYRILDPEKAKALNDQKLAPELHDAQAGVKLVVPQMEKVGALRQSSTPKAGMTYWMAFSNPTRVVKRGHRVDVVIGSFHANNLVVE